MILKNSSSIQCVIKQISSDFHFYQQQQKTQKNNNIVLRIIVLVNLILKNNLVVSFDIYLINLHQNDYFWNDL